MDEADRAQARMEIEEMLRRRQETKAELQPTGFCHYCEEPLQLPYKFCPGGECSEAYEFEKRMRNRNG